MKSETLLLVSLLTLAAPAMANPAKCELYQVSGVTTQASPVSPFTGDLTFLALASGVATTAHSSTTLLGILAVSDNGTMSAVTSHDIDSNDGVGRISVVTFDEATLRPTETAGTFSLASRATVTAGGGRFNCGEIVFSDSSTVDFANGVATLAGFAKLCSCRNVKLR